MYWIEHVLTLTAAHFLRNPGGNELTSHSTVKLGSGAGHRLTRLCRNRHEVLVTRCPPPVYLAPPMHRVAQIGSPAKISSYAFGRS